jgi:hypothetical protein
MTSVTFTNNNSISTDKIAYESIEDRYLLNGDGYYCFYIVHQYSVFKLHSNSINAMTKEAMV